MPQKRATALALLLIALYATLLASLSLYPELAPIKDETYALRPAIAPTQQEQRQQADAIFDHARHAHRHRIISQAEKLYRRALAEYQTLGNVRGQVRTLDLIGVVRRQRGDLAQAERLHKKALALAESLNDPTLETRIYNNLGIVAQLRGKPDQAKTYYERSLALNQAIGSLSAVSAAHNNLGILAKERGEFDTAERHHRLSLDASTKAGDRWGLIGAHNRLGDLERRKGNVEQARSHYKTSLHHAQSLGSAYDEGLNYLGLAFLDVAAGDTWQACDRLARSEKKLRRARAPELRKVQTLAQELACKK